MTEHKATQQDPLAEVFSPAFCIERFSLELAHELLPLFVKHFQEVEINQDIPLQPRWESYAILEANKCLRIHVARMDGEPIGYAVWFLDNNIHHGTSLFAQNDVIFVDKPYRAQLIGYKLLKFSLQQLRFEGVQDVALHVKLAHDWSRMAERLGFVKDAWIMRARLD